MLAENCRKITESVWFKNVIIIAIVAAGLEVGIETYEHIAEIYETQLFWVYNFVLIVFIIEIILKVLAEGKEPWRYFQDGWNIFDFIIVVLCFMPIDAGFVAVVRLFRILRVLKLVTAFPKLRLIVSALLKSIPSIGYVFLLQILHFYIYGAMGTTLFAVNDPYHFRNLHVAMLTLFRAVTLEDWADIMYTNIYGCDKTPYDIPSMCTNPSPSPVIAVIYFVSFIVTGAMIVLNLFIGVIMNSIKEASEENEINELIDKRASNNLNLNDEVRIIERQLQDISQEMRIINTRIQRVLQQRGGNAFLENKMPDSGEKKPE